jgi:hypothetical protein
MVTNRYGVFCLCFVEGKRTRELGEFIECCVFGGRRLKVPWEEGFVGERQIDDVS